jgi:hypothetical protein
MLASLNCMFKRMETKETKEKKEKKEGERELVLKKRFNI